MDPTGALGTLAEAQSPIPPVGKEGQTLEAAPAKRADPMMCAILRVLAHIMILEMTLQIASLDPL